MRIPIMALTASLLFTAAIGIAQNPIERAPDPQTEGVQTRTVTGTVVSATDDAITIRTREGERMSFVFEPDVDRVVEGDQVRIEFEEGDSDTLEAVEIEVISQPEPTASRDDDGELNPTAARAEADNGEPVAVTREEPAADPQAERPADPEDRESDTAASAQELPATASPLPAILLAGFTLVGAGFGARLARKRSENPRS